MGFDGYSRRILWLEVSQSNNPRVIAMYYLEAIRRLGVAPRHLRCDHGTENDTRSLLQPIKGELDRIAVNWNLHSIRSQKMHRYQMESQMYFVPKVFGVHDFGKKSTKKMLIYVAKCTAYAGQYVVKNFKV